MPHLSTYGALETRRPQENQRWAKDGQKGGYGKGGRKAEAQKTEGHDAMVADFEEMVDKKGTGDDLRESFNEAFFTDESISDLEKLLGSVDVQQGGATSSNDFSKDFSKVFDCQLTDSDDATLESYMCDAPQTDCSLYAHAVPDTACRETLVGQDTLLGLEAELKRIGKRTQRISGVS